MKLHIHGVHVPNRKRIRRNWPRCPIPETVEIPMSMHIGAPAIPVVKPGESVRVGQLIGKAGGFVSAPVYASVSGTVKKDWPAGRVRRAAHPDRRHCRRRQTGA